MSVPDNLKTEKQRKRCSCYYDEGNPVLDECIDERKREEKNAYQHWGPADKFKHSIQYTIEGVCSARS
jgi:hypothetical protein